MHYINRYHSPLGTILLAADDTGLTGLWFEDQKYFAQGLDKETEEKEFSVFQTARRWLDVYFSGKEVWEILLSIPYGETTTYGTIAKQLAAKRGLPHLSAQAVGSAVGHNKISIIVPCHRVIGADGSLTGYAGGIWRKEKLLALEQA